MSKEPYKPEEKEIMNLIVEAHNRFTQLEQTHPDEIKEWVNGIHQLQNVLGWRILRRDYPESFKTMKIKPKPPICRTINQSKS